MKKPKMQDKTINEMFRLLNETTTLNKFYVFLFRQEKEMKQISGRESGNDLCSIRFIRFRSTWLLLLGIILDPSLVLPSLCLTLPRLGLPSPSFPPPPPPPPALLPLLCSSAPPPPVLLSSTGPQPSILAHLSCTFPNLPMASKQCFNFWFLKTNWKISVRFSFSWLNTPPKVWGIWKKICV